MAQSTSARSPTKGCAWESSRRSPKRAALHQALQIRLGLRVGVQFYRLLQFSDGFRLAALLFQHQSQEPVGGGEACRPGLWFLGKVLAGVTFGARQFDLAAQTVAGGAQIRDQVVGGGLV